MQVRLVDVNSTRYAIARRYMIRIRRDDIDDPAMLAQLSSASGLTPSEFKTRFQPLVDREPPSLHLPIT